jgi:carbon storage regulator
MLVIRRRAGDSLLIGDNVEIEILALTQSYVKLGIRAPLDVPILRKEIRLTHEQNRQASGLPSLDSISDLVKLLRQAREVGSKDSPPAS